MNILLILLCYSIAYTSDKREVAADQRHSAARRSGSAKDVAARKSAILSSSSAKKVADHHVKGGGQRSSPTKAVATYRRNWAGQKTQSTRLSSSTKKVGNYRTDGAARRSGSSKVVAARKSAILSSSSAKKVADHHVKGQSSPTKAVATYRRNWAGQKTQSTRLSSTEKVGNYRRDGAAQRSVSVKNVGLKQKIPLGSRQKIDYRVPVTNVSIKPSISFTTEKTQRRGFARTVNSKSTKKMLRRIMFTTAGRDGPPRQSANNVSKKPVRFRMPTRLGRFGNLEIVTPKTTPMPTFDPLKPIGRNWMADNTTVTVQTVNIMTQIVYATQGQTMERVERIAEKYKHDTRYRIAFILLKLDQICTEMTRKQTFMERNINDDFDHVTLRRKFPFRKMISFYTDMLRQNIDVTYAVEYLFKLYKDKALERQSEEEAKKSRQKMKAAIAKNKARGG